MLVFGWSYLEMRVIDVEDSLPLKSTSGFNLVFTPTATARKSFIYARRIPVAGAPSLGLDFKSPGPP